MQASYNITQKGMMFAVASKDKNTIEKLLIFILKQHASDPVCFSQICEYFDNNKHAAFKIVCEMLESEFIDIDQGIENSDSISELTLSGISESLADKEYILSDFNGLPVHNSGFNHEDSLCISSIACDLIRISRRSDQMNPAQKQFQPASVETTWNQHEIIVYFLCFGGYSCLLTCKRDTFLKQIEAIPLIAYLCNRYANG